VEIELTNKVSPTNCAGSGPPPALGKVSFKLALVGVRAHLYDADHVQAETTVSPKLARRICIHDVVAYASLPVHVQYWLVKDAQQADDVKDAEENDAHHVGKVEETETPGRGRGVVQGPDPSLLHGNLYSSVCVVYV
jgi:hypothetical protein